MHPIERLRYVARAGWAGPAELGAEAAYALAELAETEPAALLPACRRLLQHNPTCGPLWWVAARLLAAGDALAEATRCADALEDDPTDELLAEALGDRRAVRHGGVAEVAAAEVVLVGVDALGPGGMVVDGDDLGLLEAARALEADVWVVAGCGRVLPARVWQALTELARCPPAGPRAVVPAFFDGGGAVAGTVVGTAGVAAVCGPAGVVSPAQALAACDCPEPPELVGRW